MQVLVGSTGFVGGHLARANSFDLSVHRSNVAEIANTEADLLVCAGLPAEKWRANGDPAADFENMARLAQVLATVKSRVAVLISTIDVYQPAVSVNELTPPSFDGAGAYGRHRAWFEAFFQSQFPEATVLRLPGLFGADLRKNLVHDLLHDKVDQWVSVNPLSRFQFVDVSQTWDLIRHAIDNRIRLLNVSSEPVTAQEIASLFGVRLIGDAPATNYDMTSVHAPIMEGAGGYLFDRDSVLRGIDQLRKIVRPS